MRILPAVLLLAACGDDLRGPQAPTPPPAAGPSGESQPAARWNPEVCGVQTWQGKTPADLSMSVVTGDQGAVIFGVPKSGGTVMAYAIDAQGKMSSSGVAIANTAMFTHVTASYVDGHFVVASAIGDETIMNLVTPDLAHIELLGKLVGGMIATNPIVTSRNVHVSITGGTSGVTLSAFNASWQSVVATQLAPDTIGVDAIEHNDGALFAWSTQSGCMVDSFPVLSTATGLTACRSPRLADGLGNRAELAYETPHGVFVGDLYMGGNTAIASNHFVGARGTSPRIVFDGERYWMTYLDLRGAVVVGYLSEDFGTLVSMGLEDVTPSADAYDLKIVDGQPMVFSAGVNGYAAHTICLTH